MGPLGKRVPQGYICHIGIYCQCRAGFLSSRRTAASDTVLKVPSPPAAGQPRSRRNHPMALYELRTYTLRVGAMAEAVKLYSELGFPALQKGGHDKKLVWYC